MILSIHLGISFNQLMHNFHISHFSSNDKRGLTILLKKQLKFNGVICWKISKGLTLYHIIKIFVSISYIPVVFSKTACNPHFLPQATISCKYFFLKKHEPYIFAHRYFLYIFSVLRNLFIVILGQNFLAEPF